MAELEVQSSPLGKDTPYIGSYSPSLLFPISRKTQRELMGITGTLPFHGYDIWNAFELSWLNTKGKPEVAIGEFWIPADSPCIVESKSLKLYLVSFNQTKFASIKEVQSTIQEDLSAYTQAKVKVILSQPEEWHSQQITSFSGQCLDNLDIQVNDYHINPLLLKAQGPIVEETLYSNLLKSNCLITGQPDWGSIFISYAGPQIDHEGLLKYIISFRSHNEFHEPCIERTFVDILRHCKPEKLTVFGRYTRRGGLDINPCRTNCHFNPSNDRLARQ